MSAPMSEQRLAEIMARASAATEGPWCTASWEIYQGTEYVPGMSFWIGETCRGTADLAQDAADAAFVAAARTDVPELVAEVQFLRAQVAGLEQQADQLHHDVTGACLARWEEEQDNARLRLALESARRGRLKARERIAALEALTPAPIQTCQKCGAGYDYGKPCGICEFHKQMAAMGTPSAGDPVPGACPACGESSEAWCPDCGCCRLGCYGGHEDNSCTHSRAPWQAPRG